MTARKPRPRKARTWTAWAIIPRDYDVDVDVLSTRDTKPVIADCYRSSYRVARVRITEVLPPRRKKEPRR